MNNPLRQRMGALFPSLCRWSSRISECSSGFFKATETGSITTGFYPNVIPDISSNTTLQPILSKVIQKNVSDLRPIGILIHLIIAYWQNMVHWRREWQTTSVFLPWEPHESMKRQNDTILKEELTRSVGAQYATGDQWRNNSRKNEGMEPKQKQYPAVDGTGDRSKVRCCKEQ